MAAVKVVLRRTNRFACAGLGIFLLFYMSIGENSVLPFAAMRALARLHRRRADTDARILGPQSIPYQKL